jgi:hypothetical protein
LYLNVIIIQQRSGEWVFFLIKQFTSLKASLPKDRKTLRGLKTIVCSGKFLFWHYFIAIAKLKLETLFSLKLLLILLCNTLFPKD